MSLPDILKSKIYFQEDNILLFNGDSTEIMSYFGENFVDLIITDPPYGISIHKMNMGEGGGVAKTNDYHKDATWDMQRPTKKAIELMCKVSHNQIIWGGNYMADLLPPSPCWYIWNKLGNMPSTSFADAELAWTSFTTPVRIFNYLWRGMLQEKKKNKEERVYPAQKPVELLKWCLIQNKEAETILDPYCGSGATVIACKQLGKKVIAIDKNKTACRLTVERLKQCILPFGEPTLELKI